MNSLAANNLSRSPVPPVRVPRPIRPRARRMDLGWPVALWGLVLVVLGRYTLLQRHRAFDAFSIDAVAAIEVVAISIGILLILVNPRTWRLLKSLFKTGIGFILLFQGFCVLSALWSAVPSFTIYQAGKYAVMVMLIVLAMSYCRDFYQAERVAISLIMVFLAIILTGQLKSMDFELSVYALHTNTYSGVGVMLACYCFGELRGAARARKKLLWWGFFAGLAAVILGTSGTCNIALLCGLIVAYGAARRSWLASIVIVGVIVILVSLVGLDQIQAILVPNKSTYDLQTLSGRTQLWEYYLDKAMERPLAGWGFAVATRMGDLADSHAHNAFVGAFLDTGAIGLSVLLTAVMLTGWHIAKAAPTHIPGTSGMVALAVVALVLNMSTPFLGIEWSSQAGTFYVLLALFYLAVRPRQRAAAASSLPGRI